jgi:biopolymer transport protein ExbD
MKASYVRNHKPNDDAEINITPMLDVVFIMLIFFIVTTSFTKELGLKIFSTSNSVIDANNNRKVKVATIKLDVANNHSINGIATTLEGIQFLLANLKASNPDLKVQIIASKEVKTGDLVSTIHQVKQNEINHYTVRSF